MFLFTYNSDNRKKMLAKFENIYNKYYKYAYKIAYNILNDTGAVEDTVQDVFFSIWKIIDKINDENSIKSLVGTCARNAAINTYNKNKITPKPILETLENDNSYCDIQNSCDPADIVADKDNIIRIYEYIKNNLHSKYSDVLLLKYKYNLTAEEISRLLKVNTKTVYTRINRGRRILEQNLEQNGGSHNER